MLRQPGRLQVLVVVTRGAVGVEERIVVLGRGPGGGGWERRVDGDCEAVTHTGFQGYAFVTYRERYGIPETRTVARETLRYAGFPEFVKVLVDVGYLDDAPRGQG